MPTLLELFRTQNIQAGVTAEVVYDVRDSKRIPVTSINPLIQQTGVRALNFTRNRFSERLSETLLEQELTGVRVLRAASEPVLYGTEIVRISTRTTNILDDMKASTGGTGSDGLIGGLINRAEKVGTKVLSKLGIELPQLLIPTRIALNDKFKKGLEPNTMVTLAEIKKDGAGSLVGRFLAQNINGTPSQIGRNLVGSAITGAKNSVRKLLFGTRKEGGQNLAEKNDAIFQLFDSETPYTKYLDADNSEILGRKDLSSVLETMITAAERTSLLLGPGNTPSPRQNRQTYTQATQWNSELESDRNDLSTELVTRQFRIDNDTFGGSEYEDRSNLPGSMPVGPNGVRVPTFPSKLRSNKYFWKENGNGSPYSKVNIGAVTVGNEIVEPGLIAAFENGLQYPYNDFGKAVLPEQLYRNKSLTDGTNLAGPNSTITSKYGMQNGSDAVNLTEVGQQNPDADFVFLKIGNIQFRATITSLTETFSPSWDSNKFIGNPYNYYTYSGIERSLSFNFKVYSLSCEEHNIAWDKLETLAKKVYPQGRLAYGVKPPIINFTMSNLYKSRTVFIDSLSYTTDDNTPWTISDGMTAPQIIDVAISLKFIEVNGSEGDIYDLARDTNCRVLPKSEAQRVLDKAGGENKQPITDAEPSANGGGTNTPIATSNGNTGNVPSVNEGSANSTTATNSGGGTISDNRVDIGAIDNAGIEEIDNEDTVPLIPPSTTSGISTQTTTNLTPRNLNRLPINSSGNSVQRTSPIEARQPVTPIQPLEPKSIKPIEVTNTPNGIKPQSTIPPLKPVPQSEQTIQQSEPTPPIEEPKVIVQKTESISNVGTKVQQEHLMTPPSSTTSEPRKIKGYAIYDTKGRFVSIDVEGDGNVEKVAKQNLKAWEQKNNIQLPQSKNPAWVDLYVNSQNTYNRNN
jgi:hypothetical protein